MIDMTKQYTYNGKPVRIYADGSDTVNGYMHGAKLCSYGWSPCHFKYEDLVEAWEPKEGELVYLWNDNAEHLIVAKCGFHYQNKRPAILLSNGVTGMSYDNVAPFTGTLPEAFKGL